VRVANRNISITKLLSQGFTFVKALPYLLIVVKRPIICLKYYIQCKSPEYIDLKGEKKILFSSHPHDLITFFVVFLKRDYGRVKKDSIIIDIGANIGVFSLYAALSGAKKVYAIEPSLEAFNVLCENIRINHLENVIIPFNKAISNIDNDVVRFPRSSSPYNRINNSQCTSNQTEYQEVQTMTVNALLDNNNILDVDLLKMDCEGAEFDIIPSLNENSMARIKEIRMECHGDPNQLIDRLVSNGYVVVKKKQKNVWLSKPFT